MSKLDYKFDVIGISEHKITNDSTPSNNIEIPGYENFEFVPTATNFGGTGFYIKSGLDYVRRGDLEINSPSNYESMFIEIVFPKKKNLIVGCVYRHPSSPLSIHDFTNKHLEPVLEKISKEKKQCVLMGDFNVNLMKCNTNEESISFLQHIIFAFLYSIYFTAYQATG